jgi:hypothetical protein
MLAAGGVGTRGRGNQGDQQAARHLLRAGVAMGKANGRATSTTSLVHRSKQQAAPPHPHPPLPAIGPAQETVQSTARLPAEVTRPALGLRPTTPQAAAGTRMEPPPSVPAAGAGEVSGQQRSTQPAPACSSGQSCPPQAQVRSSNCQLPAAAAAAAEAAGAGRQQLGGAQAHRARHPPTAKGQAPAASSAALPEEEPPVMCSGL